MTNHILRDTYLKGPSNKVPTYLPTYKMPIFPTPDHHQSFFYIIIIIIIILFKKI